MPSADLNGHLRLAERRNLVSAHVPSHFKSSLPTNINQLSLRRPGFLRAHDVSKCSRTVHLGLTMTLFPHKIPVLPGRWSMYPRTTGVPSASGLQASQPQVK